MADHFAAFSFVDRISEFEPGVRAKGSFAIPAGIHEFPPCLVAEAVGQLAAWVAMRHIDFRGRPVAALATETRFHHAVSPGQSLQLAVDIQDCDDEIVAYSGRADVDGRVVIELLHCLGPMLPLADFDAPEALRERFEVLRGPGATPGRFGGVALPEVVITEHQPASSLRATVRIPTHAAFFADHFPRRPVFPATLLLDAQIRLALRLAGEAQASPNADSVVPSRMSNVKMRAFIMPGQSVELHAEKVRGDGAVSTFALSARIDGRPVASAKVDIAAVETTL
jgi:3-hydroxymyristoyl/3-hydroxydecanoyl-(acyl carrier protein) dehydratase